MARHHAKNERIKRAYMIWLEDAKRMAPASVNAALAAIAGFEASTGHRDFAAFHHEQARAYKRRLAEAKKDATGKPLAKATVTARLKACHAFFVWLAGQPGYRSKINGSDAEYFNPSNHDLRIATARREKPGPSLEQVQHVIATMPAGTDLEKRDRAIVAFILLTGARDAAVASLKIRHVNLTGRFLDQDARTVKTKNRKTIRTDFFPVGEEVEAIVLDWIAHLTGRLLFGPDDPLFPKTKVLPNAAGLFSPAGLERAHWSNAGPIRDIFKRAFPAAGQPYFNPHSLRKTLMRLAFDLGVNGEAIKAWSQNLGHEKLDTSFNSYGTVSAERQQEIMDRLRSSSGDRTACAVGGAPDKATIKRVLEHISRTSV